MENSTWLIRRPTNRVARLSRQLLVSSLIALLLCWSLPNRAQAAAGDLDLTFGSGGKVTTNFFNVFGPSVLNQARGVVVQPDGKVIAVGLASSLSTSFVSGFALIRYNNDGSLDASFGSGGKAFTNFFRGAEAEAVALQPDGKIVVVGSAFQPSLFSNLTFAVARFNSDGSLDSSFGTGGLVTTDFFTDQFGQAMGLAIQPDGKIIAVGIVAVPNTLFDFGIARYNADGSLDLTFGVGGKVMTDFFGHEDFARDVALQADGKIVVLGDMMSPNSVFIPGLARYNPDGTLDPSFGTGGKVSSDLGFNRHISSGLALQSDGKIVAAGIGSEQFDSLGFILRYNTDGSPDMTFGVQSQVFLTFVPFIEDMVVQPDDKIVVAGTNDSFSGTDFGLARLNRDGSLDLSFGTNAHVFTDFLGSTDQAFAVALGPDGKIVAAGRAVDASLNTEYFAVARYNGDVGVFDTCVQDDSNGNLLTFDSLTGDYQFTRCGSGITLSGKGTVTKRGSLITLQDATASRKVVATVDGSTKRATASIQVFSLGSTFTITDRNTTNNTCGCP